MEASLLSTLVIVLALAGLAILRAGRRARDRRQARQHELVLLRLGEARGRQEILDEVRMLEHGQLKAHILALQHCLTLARDAESPEQRAAWLDEGLTQTRRLLEVVVMLHQAVGSSALPSDLECTLADVAQSLAVAYPACACRVEVSGQRPAHLGEPIQRALILVLYNALSNAYTHGRPAMITVQLQYAPDALILVVCDDGQGMDDADLTRRPGGRGLRDVRQLMAQHGGTLLVASEPQAGTRITATFPLDRVAGVQERSP
ncbi:MAG: ATP-binding protein [Chloroflexales bacterium]